MSIAGKVADITAALNDYCTTCAADAIPRIESAFAPFHELPDPGDFDSPMGDVTAGMEFICAGNVSEDPVTQSPMFANPVLGGIDLVGDELVEWRGDAAESFRDNVQTPFPYITQNLFIGSAVLAGAIEAEKALWTAVAADINDAADKALEAARQLGETGGAEASFLITCVGAVVAVALAPVTAGASVAAAVSSRASIAAARAACSPASRVWRGKCSARVSWVSRSATPSRAASPAKSPPTSSAWRSPSAKRLRTLARASSQPSLAVRRNCWSIASCSTWPSTSESVSIQP
jgi:hypothetical protein